MTGAEIAAVIGAVVWAIERIFSWRSKGKHAKKLKVIEDTVTPRDVAPKP